MLGLYGVAPAANINKLQRVENALARIRPIVMLTKQRDHIKLLLAELHWLPISARIDFKISLLTIQGPH